MILALYIFATTVSTLISLFACIYTLSNAVENPFYLIRKFKFGELIRQSKQNPLRFSLFIISLMAFLGLFLTILFPVPLTPLFVARVFMGRVFILILCINVIIAMSQIETWEWKLESKHTKRNSDSKSHLDM